MKKVITLLLLCIGSINGKSQVAIPSAILDTNIYIRNHHPASPRLECSLVYSQRGFMWNFVYDE
ncbi:MAG: hypothetical protein RIQ33_1984 [Bacteroidota bacterium]|jgi:hypothetical protein